MATKASASDVTNINNSLNTMRTLNTINILLANGQTMTKTAGSAYGYNIYANRWIVFFTVAVTCTTARNKGTGVFLFRTPGGKELYIDEPYHFQCVVNNQGPFLSARAGDNNQYIDIPLTTWNAGTEFRVAGVGLMAEIN